MKAIVIGASAGGICLFTYLFTNLVQSFPYPVFIAQHIPEDMPDNYLETINSKSPLSIKEAHHNEQIQSGYVYFAPAGYHLLIESEYCLSLSVDKRVHFSRPSIDVLFQSAAEIYKSDLLGIILSGANHDGLEGAQTIVNLNGEIWVQSPNTAEAQVDVVKQIKTHQLSNFL